MTVRKKAFVDPGMAVIVILGCCYLSIRFVSPICVHSSGGMMISIGMGTVVGVSVSSDLSIFESSGAFGKHFLKLAKILGIRFEEHVPKVTQIWYEPNDNLQGDIEDHFVPKAFVQAARYLTSGSDY